MYIFKCAQFLGGILEQRCLYRVFLFVTARVSSY